MATSLLKFALKTNLVKSVISEIVSNISKYYYAYGRISQWDDETSPEEVSDSFVYENATRNNLVLYKQIDANDVAAVVKRIDWVAGYTFDMFDEYSSTNVAFSGATTIDNAEFYCLTEEFNVYKCLFNNGNRPSSVRPTGTSTTPIQLNDGYIWKYMYTIPLSVRNKFLTSTIMPVSTALTNQFYSKGSIVSFTIENPGKGYPITSYKVTGFRIIDGGSGYNSEPTITISNPDQAGGVPALVDQVVIASGSITAIFLAEQGSGYSYPPIVSISGGGATREAVVEPIIERIGNTYTNLIVTGDGVLEENPYQVQEIQIISGGQNYQSVEFLFTDPDLPNGSRVVATANITGGTVTSVTINNPGFGYSKPFYSIFQNANASNIVLTNVTPVAGQVASGLQFNVITKKNEAELKPIINANGEIESIIITKPGIGYTYALVTIESAIGGVPIEEDPPADFQTASILLNFGIGDVESQQSTVEITAIEGAIHVIKVDDPGFGYTSPPLVKIEGDGSGCTATSVLNANGSIEKINVITPGSGYTKATVSLVNQLGEVIGNAHVRAIISPKGGHGRDAVGELYSKTLVLHGNLSKEKNKGFAVTNPYRQICIIKNPKTFGQNNNIRSSIASTCIIAIGSKDQSSFPLIAQGDKLTFSSEGKSYQFTVVEKNANYSATESALLLTYDDNFIPPAGSSFGKIGAVFNSSEIISPDVNKFSGDLLTIDNRQQFSPSTQQIVVAINSITF